MGNLANLQSLVLRGNLLTGTVPSTFTNLGAMRLFYFYVNAGLCAQDAAAIRAWLNGVSDVQGPNCSPAVRLSVSPSRLVEGDGATPVTLTATRTAVSSATTVDLRVGGSAVAERDYRLMRIQRITLLANSASGTTMLTITPLTDAVTENDEYIIVEAVVSNKAQGSAIITLSDPDAPTPGRPPAPAVSATTPYSLTVSWTEPQNTGPPITDYDVRYREAAGSAAFTGARHAGTARTATLTGLTPDTAYDMQVRAANAAGTGAWSDSTRARTLSLLTGNQTYYFPHLAVGAGWQTTITYINYSSDEVSCRTDFLSDQGAPLMVSFPSLGPDVRRSDVLPPGGSVHEETDVGLSAPLAAGWAKAVCTGPVKASLLFRQYDSAGVPVAEAGVNAAVAPATRFVTFAERAPGQLGTGVAYANPSDTAAVVTFTARDETGRILTSVNQTLMPNGHGAQNMAGLFTRSSFTGSLEITSTEPIVSLSLNAEASPIFSSLPPGEPDASAQGATTYYFPHLAVGASWQTTITYINYSSQEVTCETEFISDHGSPLLVSFPGRGMVVRRPYVLPPGGSMHEETDVELSAPLVPGWAKAACTGPVKASLLFRQYDSEGEPVAEAGVNATSGKATRFITFAEQAEGKTGTGVAYANPSETAAHVTFTAKDTTGETLASEVRTLLPDGHNAHVMSTLFGFTSFSGSLEVTSTEPIVSLSLNFEAAPVFSSLPPGEVD